MIGAGRRKTVWECRQRGLEVGERTLTMGVVNVTPDSFSDGGQFVDANRAIAHALRLVREGADIIDVGGESTRPESDPVPDDVEIQRVLPVIEHLARETSTTISVDTTKAGVAQEALRAGAHIVNDISGFHYDPDLPKVVAEYGAGVVLMHIRAHPKDMQADTFYHDLFGEISMYLREGMDKAEAAGISHEAIVVDPGIGFGKSVMDNYRLIDGLERFRQLQCPILVGPSRKSFIGNVLNLPVDQRIWGTAAAVACAVLRGADIVRVHDVAEMVQVTTICDTFLRSRNGSGTGE